jgi:hypothetical protein
MHWEDAVVEEGCFGGAGIGIGTFEVHDEVVTQLLVKEVESILHEVGVVLIAASVLAPVCMVCSSVGCLCGTSSRDDAGRVCG